MQLLPGMVFIGEKGRVSWEGIQGGVGRRADAKKSRFKMVRNGGGCI